jgi:hypothetical protein
MRGTRIGLLLAIFALSVTSTADAEIYKYVDDSGRTHYTDSFYEVPEQYRDQIRDIRTDLDSDNRLSVIEGLNASPDTEAGAAHSEAPEGFMAQMQQALEAAQAQAQAGNSGAPTPADLKNLGGGMLIAVIVGMLLMLPVMAAIAALFLKMACSLSGEEPIGFGKAMLVALMQAIAGGLASGGSQAIVLIAPTSMAVIGTALVLSLVLTVVAYAAVLRGMHCETFGAAVKVTIWRVR